MKAFRCVPAILLGLAATTFGASPSSGRRADWVRLQDEPPKGLGVNVPVIGRIIGGGGVLFQSSMDVSNNTPTAVQVDAYIDLRDQKDGTSISADASISSTGALVAQGTGGNMPGRTNAHFEDFIHSLIQVGLIPASAETDGVFGSALFVFRFGDDSKSGQGAAEARFYNSFGGGTIGVAVKGQEITLNEPTRLIGYARDSRGASSGPQVYSNLFINNAGLPPAGSGTAGAASMTVSAYSAKTGAAVGTPLAVNNVALGATVVVADVFAALHVPSTEKDILVQISETSGNAALAAIMAIVDQTTRDSSGFVLSRADF